jgi:uncharacterized protein with HEPN domain
VTNTLLDCRHRESPGPKAGEDPHNKLDQISGGRSPRRVTKRTLDEYLADEDFRLAIKCRIEIIGKAARRVSAEFKAHHPEIPWRAVMAQRHVLAQDYDEVIDAKIWKVATTHIPALISQLEGLVPEVPPGGPAG